MTLSSDPVDKNKKSYLSYLSWNNRLEIFIFLKIFQKLALYKKPAELNPFGVGFMLWGQLTNDLKRVSLEL
jgi:hypothetical protein